MEATNHSDVSTSDFYLGWHDETTAVLVRLVRQHLARDIGPQPCPQDLYVRA